MERLTLASHRTEYSILYTSHLICSNSTIGIGNRQTVAFVVVPVISTVAGYKARRTVVLQTFTCISILIVSLRTADLIAFTVAALPVVELSFKTIFKVRALAGTSWIAVPGLSCVGTATLTDTFTLAGISIVESNSQIITLVASSFVLFNRKDDSSCTGESISNNNGQIIASTDQFEIQFSDRFPSVPRIDGEAIQVNSKRAACTNVEDCCVLRTVRVEIGVVGNSPSDGQYLGCSFRVHPLPSVAYWVSQHSRSIAGRSSVRYGCFGQSCLFLKLGDDLGGEGIGLKKVILCQNRSYEEKNEQLNLHVYQLLDDDKGE